MQRIFLLRAYGDFIIALQAIIKSNTKIHIVASDHLKPLYKALLATNAIPNLSIEFIALGIQHGQLGFFTNKYFFSFSSYQSLQRLKYYIQSNPNTAGVDYVEQHRRIGFLNFLTGHFFKPVVQRNINVYQAYATWLSAPSIKEVAMNTPNMNDVNGLNVLIIPDARLQKRVLQPTLLNQVKQYVIDKAATYKVARMKQALEGTDMVYHNFDELIHYILAADFVVCSDSLPAHLAYLFNKPHYIFYPKNGMTQFFTPYALLHNSVGHFEQPNFSFLNQSGAA
jgi:ADP-heptose:LPS heptosyltransferase